MTFYFGLSINRNLSDIDDPRQALLNLNLDPKDLERIKGVTDPGGVSRSDFKSLSGLVVDLEKTAGSLFSETGEYNILTTDYYDEYSLVDNNVNVNGQLAATAIKYRYLDDLNAVKVADISTSRVSSWSSFDSPVLPTSPIFYGGQVDLEGTLELSDLNINAQAEPKRFASEVPTHRIKVIINGEEIFLLAMKGIPLAFRGFFRNAVGVFVTVSPISGLPNVRPSWTIKNTADSLEYVYENVLTASTSQITFRDTASKLRDINFFYPIDNITGVSLPNIGLVELPAVTLVNLNYLDISNNDVREFPNFANFSSLADLRIQNNNLARSRTPALRAFTSSVVARIPASIRRLTIGNCFEGDTTGSLEAYNIVYFDCNANGGQNKRMSGISPAVNSATIEDYIILWNLFTNVSSTVKTSVRLKTIDMSYNNFQGATDMSFASQEITSFISVSNTHNLVDLSGRPNLTIYYFYYSNISAGASNVEPIFNGCVSLQNIILYATNVTGRVPAFLNCTSLSYVDLRFTGVTDAVAAGGGNPAYAVGENTLSACRRTISYFMIISSNFTSTSQMHPTCFRQMPTLFYVEISSNGVGIAGTLPDFSSAPNLTYLFMYNNRLSGSIPNFTNNQRLFFVILSNNFLTGTVPNIPGTNCQHLILTNNQLDTFTSIDTTSLIRIHLAFNNITRIPDLSNLNRLQELLLNNQRIPGGSQMAYTAGSFVGLTAIRNLNVSNNAISQGFIDQIIEDMSANYDANPRRGVTVNLSGNAAPSTSTDVISAIAKLQSVGWQLLTE
jgi:hypothetical protein